MSNVLTPQKTGRGWIIEIDDDFASELGVAKGSIVLMNARDGKIETEILSPSPELEKSVDRIFHKYKEAFEEMKRLGD
ncbi:MAG: hypothetical protein LH472_13260 [Pyrinomonadaceae bacterium]|nr:hypothetical protein [Pyrinomonadaceae bacterium]